MCCIPRFCLLQCSKTVFHCLRNQLFLLFRQCLKCCFCLFQISNICKRKRNFAYNRVLCLKISGCLFIVQRCFDCRIKQFLCIAQCIIRLNRCFQRCLIIGGNFRFTQHICMRSLPLRCFGNKCKLRFRRFPNQCFLLVTQSIECCFCFFHLCLVSRSQRLFT